MLWVLSFLMFLGSAVTVGLLGADRFYARYGAGHPASRSDVRQWAPGSAVVLDDLDARPSVLPTGIRSRLWSLAGLTFLLGCLLLAFAA